MIKCEICGETEKIATKTKRNKFGMVLCKRHYKQMTRHGHILKRTIYDKNTIVLDGNTAKIELYNKMGDCIAEAIIDADDIERVVDLKWTLNDNNRNYVKNIKHGIYIHRLIANAKDGDIVDHIDRNPLNNRKNNLRLVSSSQNSQNKSLQVNNTSGFIGVYWISEKNKWRAEIQINGESKSLGYFHEKNEAIIARLKAEKQYFGEEFAPQRNLFNEYGIS